MDQVILFFLNIYYLNLKFLNFNLPKKLLGRFQRIPNLQTIMMQKKNILEKDGISKVIKYIHIN